MAKKRSPPKRELPGRPPIDGERRHSVEVTLLGEDIDYARELTGGNLSAALTMLIRQHRKRNG